LVDAVRAHAGAGVDKTVGAAEDVRLTYPELWAGATACAARLRGAGVEPGTRVVVETGTSTAVLCAALGVLAAGAVLVPVAATPSVRPDSADNRRVTGIVRASGAGCYLTCGDAVARADLLATAGLHLTVLPVEDVAAEGVAGAGEQHPLPPVLPEQAALLQFSSGSLAAPKGILLSHRNLVVNVWAGA
jgi:acyl-CoA synthetase (AMP-forming)/AMP-acid ligase II